MSFYAEISNRSIEIAMSAGRTCAFWKYQKEKDVKMAGGDGT